MIRFKKAYLDCFEGENIYMKFIYGKLKMSWLTVIVFAVAAGCYTGWIMTVDCLKGTSFQDIGIFFEWWVIFAVIIVVNCKKSWEAMLKCFLFFLISQPLVFLWNFCWDILILIWLFIITLQIGFQKHFLLFRVDLLPIFARKKVCQEL